MANGQWSHKESVLRLRVAPPWYKSVPMIIVYVILCLSILILAVEKLSQRNIANAELNVADIALNMAMSRASLYNKVNSSFNKGVAALIEERRCRWRNELFQHLDEVTAHDRTGLEAGVCGLISPHPVGHRDAGRGLALELVDVVH